jgi:F0F1-type ATP synthase membrane subunit b/b'
MIGAGTFINPLMRIVVVVAILAAVYFFAIKPVLDTTNNAINSTNRTINGAVNNAFNRANDLAQSSGATRIHIPQSASTQKAQRLLRCVQRAAPDVTKIEACQRLFGP